MNIDRTRRNESGSVLVEAALTMLGFLIILFAIFEAGRMMSIQQTLTNAAREGARLSVLPAWGGTDTLPTTTQVQARVQTFLDASGLNGAAATVSVNQCCDPSFPSANTCSAPTGTPPRCPAGEIQYSRVTITVPYKVVSISMFSLLEVNLRGQGTMRNETNLQ
jgi:Flp pilus assembly protein TadG